MSPHPEIRWLSISDYARRYAVHRNTVRKWLAAGLLVTYRLEHVIRVQDAPPLGAVTNQPDLRNPKASVISAHEHPFQPSC